MSTWLEGYDGARLRARHWSVPGQRHALLLTGRNEPIDKFDETAHDLVERGFDVWGFDWRGQGGSTRPTRHADRGHIGDFVAYLADLHAVLRQLELDSPVVVGHSMGGHLALRYAHEHPRAFSAMVLSAPMIEIHAPPLGAGRVRQIARFLTGLGFAESHVFGHRLLHEKSRHFSDNDLTGDRRRFERNIEFLDANPEFVTGGATWGWLAAALDSTARARAPGFPEAIQTPTLMVSAERDTVVSNDAQRDYVSRMPNARCIVLEGAKHEILQESDAIRARFWVATDTFLRSVLAAA